VKTVIANCGKINRFLAHLSVKVTKNNFYIISWACVVGSFYGIKKPIIVFIIRDLCRHKVINETVIKKIFP